MGNGYSSAPMVSISPSYGAVIETVINSDGEVTAATLTTPPNRTFSNGPPTLLVMPPPVQYSADVEVDGRGGRTHQFLECVSNRPYLARNEGVPEYPAWLPDAGRVHRRAADPNAPGGRAARAGRRHHSARGNI